MKRSQPRRDWRQAREKLELEGGACRNCGAVIGVECAHVVGREHDRWAPIRNEECWRPWTVHPDRIIPLCGPATDGTSCHGKQHAGRLDVLRLLTLPEQIQAVADVGGISLAMKRLSPAANPRRVAA